MAFQTPSLAHALLHSELSCLVLSFLPPPSTFVQELFRPWQSEVKQMNKDLFVHSNGLKYLLELQGILLDTEWEKSSNDMKRMERVILQTIYHLASTFKLRRYILNY